MELNPNHPVTAEFRQQWHKLCAILMLKFGHSKIQITSGDIQALIDSGTADITMRAKGEVITLELVDDAEGRRLAREEGGLPI